MINSPFRTVRGDPGGRIGVPAPELVNAFVGRRIRFARSSLPAKPGSQQANSGIAWQGTFRYCISSNSGHLGNAGFHHGK
jgi:hypothetical protein